MSSNINGDTSNNSIPPKSGHGDKFANAASANLTADDTDLKHENSQLIMSIPVDVQIVLGSAAMPVSTLMSLGQGSVITLDKKVGDPVEVVVNGRIIAKGEIIVMDDDAARFGVSLTEILGK